MSSKTDALSVHIPARCLTVTLRYTQKHLHWRLKEVTPFIHTMARTQIILNYNVSSTQEKYFKDADKYIPERWLKSGTGQREEREAFAFVPFGFGPRMCIGRRIAELEMFTLLTKTAIETYEKIKKQVVIGQDVDLIVLPAALTPDYMDILMLKEGKGKVKDRFYSSKDLRNSNLVIEFKKSILFLHAISGCDTTSEREIYKVL
ncbi:hypothetical protein AVEN_189790-1 [Araneus ventricosus]|uniref:Uncharacterized protein n=1 Tax=Araneus ventricosus TaxID=182803 RepID=A0A4Y2DFD0_ARAVE|nr:hypothetical protein AVEN_189790-1 [Araneus ventricosus]